MSCYLITARTVPNGLTSTAALDTAEKVESQFDGIAYDKGGSVLRMLRAYLDRDMNPQPPLRRALLQVFYLSHQENISDLGVPVLAICQHI